MKKILYGVSGIGSGHANRELPIITELAKKHKIVVLCYDDSFITLQREFPNHPHVILVKIAVPFVVGNQNGLDFGASAVHPWNQNINFTKINFQALDAVFKEIGKPDLAITDYEPVTAQYAYSYNIPLVTIDQQSKFLHSDLPKTIAGFTYEDEVRRLQMFFPKASNRIVCSFFKNKKRINGEDVTFFPSPIKGSIKNLTRKPSSKTSLLVYISSARDFVQSPQEIISVLSQVKSTSFSLFVNNLEIDKYQTSSPNICLYPHGSDDFINALISCHGVITTAGHSLLSECMHLAIPVYAIPVSPYEQHLNAKIIQDNGFGVSVDKLDPKKISDFIDKLKIYISNIKNDENVLLSGDGTELIVDHLTKEYLSSKKILLFSPPFSGHLNILKELIKDTKHLFDYHLVITGWDNIKPDLTGIEGIGVSLLAKEDLKETDPALWTLHRADLLLSDALKIVEDFSPDLIIYDFFSIEGNLAGKLKNIPYYCSIPAFVGPNDKQNYLQEKLSLPINTKALSSIKEKYKVDINIQDFEMVSDGLHLPGLLNLIWSFADVTPSNYSDNRSTAPSVFFGNLRGDNYEKTNFKNNKPLIYLSFGTVVMDNLWNQQKDTRSQLVNFFKDLAEKWKDKDYQIIFVTQGKQILDEYPQNWWVYNSVDQVEILSRADVFITHGGSNSFHEALMQKVPMVVIPFFGDQLLVAKNIDDKQFGIKVGGSDSIDTHASKNFLNKNLVSILDTAVSKILSSSAFVNQYSSLPLHYHPIVSLLRREIPLQSGDLLLGDKYATPEKYNHLPHLISTYLSLLGNSVLRHTPSSLNNLLFVLNYLTQNQKDNSIKTKTLLSFFSRFYQVHYVGFSDTSKDLTKNATLELGKNLIFYEQKENTWVPLAKDFATAKNNIDLKLIKKIIVTSEKEEKINAVKKSLGGHHNHVLIVGKKPNLPVDEQLIGLDEIIKSSLDRLIAVKNQASEDTLLVSIVSGLVKISNIYHDVAVFFVQTPSGDIYYDKSLATPLPTWAVEKLLKRGTSQFTVGSVLAETESDHNISTDPQSYLYLSKITRTDLLTDTLKKILA